MTGQPADVFPQSPSDRSFLGHPRGLAFLAFTEAWERFSFYGMSGLLMLYMVQRLFLPGVAGEVIGLAGLRRGVEGIAGPLSDQAFASQIYGLYSGFVYFTPVFGGMLADRLLGQRWTVMAGAVLMSAGHLLMALDAGFLIALVLLIVGCGCLKGNISAQVGHLYPLAEEGRRTRAFAIFSAAINAGAIVGPLVCGIVAQVWGWHAGFATAGVLMLAGLATYAAGWRHLPPDRKRARGERARQRLDAADWRVIAALLVVALIAVLPATAYYQETNSGLLFIEASVDRRLLGWTVPTASYNALDGLFSILVVPPLIALWRWQGRHGGEPGDIAKIATGYAIIALANALMIVPAGWAEAGGRVSAAWPVLLYALNALGFMFYWPTLLAMFSRAAPGPVNGTMMGLLFFSTFLGNLLVGILGALWEEMPHSDFFALHAALAFGPFLLMTVVARPIARILEPPA